MPPCREYSLAEICARAHVKPVRTGVVQNPVSHPWCDFSSTDIIFAPRHRYPPHSLLNITTTFFLRYTPQPYLQSCRTFLRQYQSYQQARKLKGREKYRNNTEELQEQIQQLQKANEHLRSLLPYKEERIKTWKEKCETLTKEVEFWKTSDQHITDILLYHQNLCRRVHISTGKEFSHCSPVFSHQCFFGPCRAFFTLIIRARVVYARFKKPILPPQPQVQQFLPKNCLVQELKRGINPISIEPRAKSVATRISFNGVQYG